MGESRPPLTLRPTPPFELKPAPLESVGDIDTDEAEEETGTTRLRRGMDARGEGEGAIG